MHREKSQAVLIAATLLIVTSLGSGQIKPTAPNPSEPKITAVRFVTFPKSAPDGSVEFRLAIEGENLPNSTKDVKILFDTKDPDLPVNGEPIVASKGKEIEVKGTAKAKTEVTRIRIVLDNRPVAETKAFTISFTENPPAPKVKQFEVKLEHEKNKEFPNLHSLVVSKEGGDGAFADKPHLMTVDLMPSGATDVNIVQSNPQQLDLHFVAAADYVPTSVVVTVYNSSDLDTRQAVAVAVSKKAPEDPDQPKVTGTEIVFINRSHGVGRIRVLGKGFGDHDPPPYPVDDYLWNCLEEFHIRGTDRYSLPVQQLEFDDIEQRIEACRRMLGGDVNTVVGDELRAGKRALESKAQDKAKSIKPSEEPVLKKQIEDTKTNLASFVEPKVDPLKPNDKAKPWETWAENIRKAVTVSVHSRNPAIQVEKVEILDVNDKMIDVYIEFTRYRGYSRPLRLEDSTVTIKKTVQKTTQTVKNDKLTGTVTGTKEETYSVNYPIEPKRDPNLTYKYTVLDNGSANTLVGKGVADHFYVLQLSVVNNGEKKVAIPLAAIQAEVEWIRGTNPKKGVEFAEGPPTLAPIPLADVSSYFDAYQKVKGFRAHLFNGLDAATVMATALVPFTGPSFKDAEVFFSGGFIPGLRKGVGDLSSQQLQNLTSLSWESSETLPAKGGSMDRLIYIQKRSQQFESKPVKAIAVPSVTTSQISDIMGLEITGYEVVESNAKPASPAPATPSAPGKTTTPAPTTPQSPAPATPATPAAAESNDERGS